MSDHDPLCPLRFQGGDSAACIECAHVRRVRADERERIARALIAGADALIRDWPQKYMNEYTEGFNEGVAQVANIARMGEL